MNRHERTAFLRSDEDDPDYLRDKPMGRCPWCDRALTPILASTDRDDLFMVSVSCHSIGCRYMAEETELANRARYQEERMAAAKIEERVNRELSRRGE